MLSRRERYQIDVVKPSKQDATERVLNWNEVYQAYTPELAVIEAQRCLLCEHAPCMQACPLHNDIPGALFLLGDAIFWARQKGSSKPPTCLTSADAFARRKNFARGRVWWERARRRSRLASWKPSRSIMFAAPMDIRSANALR